MYVNNIDLKLMLLKLDFFERIKREHKAEDITNFFNNEIRNAQTMKAGISNNKEDYSSNYLFLISEHPVIVKSKHYQSIVEEANKFLLIALKKAIFEYLYEGESYKDNNHTHDSNEYLNCISCSEEYYYQCYYQRYLTIEEELWKLFVENTQYFTNQSNYLPFDQDNNQIIEFQNKFEHANDNFLMDLIPEDLNLELIKRESLRLSGLAPKDVELTIINEEQPQEENTQSSILRQTICFTKSTIDQEVPTVKKEKSILKKTFFKDFHFKSIKRENIDKKFIRKSKKFLKDLFKKNKFSPLDNFDLDENQKRFWIDYFTNNLLPPMQYTEQDKLIEFKSFNTDFIIWLFSHKGSVEIFNIYLVDKFDEIFQGFIKKYSIVDVKIQQELEIYLKNLPNIYHSTNLEKVENKNIEMQEENKKMEEEPLENENCHNCIIHNLNFDQNPRKKLGSMRSTNSVEKANDLAKIFRNSTGYNNEDMNDY